MSNFTKVFLLQRIITNYRVPVFKKIAKLNNVDLTVFYSEPCIVMQKENLRNSNKIEGFRTVKIPTLETKKRAYQFSFLKYILVERPDVVIGRDYEAWDSLLFLVWCKLLRIKIIWWQSGVPFLKREEIERFSNEGFLSKLFKKFNPKRLIGFQADGMIVYSAHAKNYYCDLGFKRNIFVAPNSPDTNNLLCLKRFYERNPKKLRELRNKYAPNGQKIIFMLGRLNVERKADVLIRAFEFIQQEYEKVSLIIIGEGEERKKLERMVLQKKLNNVFFLGAIYDDTILAQYFLLSDVYVTPGIASLTIKMAMTFGKPVVSVAYGMEIHSIIDKKNGFVVDVDDIDDLTNKILLLFRNDKLKIDLGNKAARIIQNYINIENMIDGFQKAIVSVVNI